MGLKRKLSFSESPYLSPPPSSPPSASHSNTPPSQDQLPDAWSIAGRPYINLRTRKRYRDNRPSEDTIHERTLEKLFSAQQNVNLRMSSPESMMGEQRKTSLQSISLQKNAQVRSQGGRDAIFASAMPSEIPADRNQQRLDAFFHSLHPSATTTMNFPTSPSQLHLQSPLYRPFQVRPSSIPCEDCSAPLFIQNINDPVNTQMMDVDMGDTELADAWQCAICAKRVCDTCAVRGDYRVCLECAVPGGGKYAREHTSKLWVDGIGWM